jgi:hypothetical protein
MAKATPELIHALRETAKKLETGVHYEWGHMGSCNCGNLAQELTPLTKKEIHDYAMRKYGDWTEQAMDYCSTSGMTLDFVISTMLQSGLELSDIRHLEYLSDHEVLRTIPLEQRYLRHNKREDVVTYVKAWANLLEDQYISKVKIEDTVKESKTKDTRVREVVA